MIDTEAFVAEQIRLRPIEARIVRKVIKALKESGTPVVSVWDSEEDTKATTKQEIMALVFNLDEAFLITESGAWVRLIMGEDPQDMICDYGVSLEEALAPVFSWIESHTQ